MPQSFSDDEILAHRTIPIWCTLFLTFAGFVVLITVGALSTVHWILYQDAVQDQHSDMKQALVQTEFAFSQFVEAAEADLSQVCSGLSEQDIPIANTGALVRYVLPVLLDSPHIDAVELATESGQVWTLKQENKIWESTLLHLDTPDQDILVSRWKDASAPLINTTISREDTNVRDLRTSPWFRAATQSAMQNTE